MQGQKQVEAIIIGAGSRGTNYAEYALAVPLEFKIVGVADPRKFHRTKLQQQHNIPPERCYNDWKDVVQKQKFADCVVVATPDQLHKEPAVAFASLGYHILLEKPMATTVEECKEIVSTCKKNNVLLCVCHVLRYCPPALKLKELIASGVIGDVMSIQHIEPVGFWHFAHSYVRGNWRNEAASSFSLLAKSCHDIDLIQYWMGNRKCTKVSSFGSLMHFKKADKPADAGSRCVDCSIEQQCPYSAKKVYLDRVKKGHTGWPCSVITEVPDIESVTEALKSGPYGRCVYDCDNDVMSNQVVNMQFEGGATASFSMVACTEKLCAREVKVFGTKGELSCYFPGPVYHYDFLTGVKKAIPFDNPKVTVCKGHSGADYCVMQNFVKSVMENDFSKILSGPDETLTSHLLVFAAEQSRLEERVVKMDN